ncbi:MAG: alanine--tRNA ligase [Deltaproteobacteria bacterium]|nr:alanine--tRNA ligase [Deltaproteobacteria bacterium]
MKSSEIRSRFLNYFAGHGHQIVPSGLLVPENDPTLYFVNAGMVPFKDVFTGKEQRDYSRATTVQKCLRVSGKHNDLDMVGRTPRHHTFFEMMGNFSFGDYFKAEAIPMAWELLTGELGLDPARLWVTIFETDDEAFDLWRGEVGVPAERIQRLGEKDNFWSMGDVGPCGPCSEIHYDHGAAFGPGGGPATESDRYIEIWNLVFMQYEQFADGRRELLPRPSIDTGSGLERVAAALQGVYSNYETDLFQGLIQRAAQEAGVRYGADRQTDTALQVIADHARASAFLIGDGVMPSNEGRGYVLRRIMRRAIRFGVKLGMDKPFFHHITRQVMAEFGTPYPTLLERERFVDEVVQGEEDRFRLTLDRGMRLLEGELERLPAGASLSGDVAFTLKDTFGFPLDLTHIIAGERGVGVDESGFHAREEEQRQRGRAAWKGSGEAEVAALWHGLAAEHGKTSFTGYERLFDRSEVMALVRKGADGSWEQVEALAQGQEGVAVLASTCLYGEAGGQVGDSGRISAQGLSAAVRDTTRVAGLFLHHLSVEQGALQVGGQVEVSVDPTRAAIRRNHTATHLLHAALRQVVGDHVQQKGSMVSGERLRFDFSHHRGLTDEQIQQVEDLVNAQVLANLPVSTELKDLDEARAAGAMALFGEKYDQQVRVVSVPGFSVELCGGTHVGRTGDIGSIRVVGQGSVAAGVRRLEALTGTEALLWDRARGRALEDASALFKTTPDGLVEAIGRLQGEKRRLEGELSALQVELARQAAGDLVSQARDFGGVKVLAAEFDGDLKEQVDRLRDQLGTSVVFLFANRGDKVQLVVAATKDIAGKRAHAGNLIREIAPLVGGGGGGRPDMAQAGGKDPSGIPSAIARAYAWAAEALV